MLTPPFVPLMVALAIALDSATPADPLAWLVNYGVAGIFIALLATGQFRTKAELNAKDKHIDHLQQELASKDKVIEAFQLQLTSHTLPALAQSTRVLEAIPESRLVSQLSTVQGDVASLIERLEALTTKGGDPT